MSFPWALSSPASSLSPVAGVLYKTRTCCASVVVALKLALVLVTTASVADFCRQVTMHRTLLRDGWVLAELPAVVDPGSHHSRGREPLRVSLQHDDDAALFIYHHYTECTAGTWSEIAAHDIQFNRGPNTPGEAAKHRSIGVATSGSWSVPTVVTINGVDVSLVLGQRMATLKKVSCPAAWSILD
jgi:hypothetical protein